MTLEGRAVAEETEKGKATHALVVETAQPLLSADRPEINRLGGDLCDETVHVERDRVEAETCSSATESEAWDLRGPDRTQAEEQKYAVSLVLFVQPALVIYFFFDSVPFLTICHLLL